MHTKIIHMNHYKLTVRKCRLLYMLFISVGMPVNQILYTSAFIDNVRHAVDQH